ncbi:hypothetical protein V5799_029772 [Amblyomma americanum]|uniref:Uncharacterized protein n=1 Tax=Amblyomma americanum TaxID=6943 RepID=A0AAQ4EQA3_AMBAM
MWIYDQRPFARKIAKILPSLVSPQNKNTTTFNPDASDTKSEVKGKFGRLSLKISKVPVEDRLERQVG